jgi:Protein of unknown function (DUF3168)
MTANPRLFSIIAGDSSCTALLGVNPTRFYPYSQAPKGAPRPYAVYGVITALPQNYLDDRADIDQKGTQIDIYAESAAACEATFNAIRDAIEPSIHKCILTNFSTPALDSDTNSYHARMEVDVWEQR